MLGRFSVCYCGAQISRFGSSDLCLCPERMSRHFSALLRLRVSRLAHGCLVSSTQLDDGCSDGFLRLLAPSALVVSSRALTCSKAAVSARFAFPFVQLGGAFR